MTTLLLAVVSASLLGSLHCAGMCGPFALYASTVDGRVRVSRLTAYHLGRLLTYLIVGVVVGLTGRAVDASGNSIGLPVAAAQVAGLMLIVLAVSRLWPRSPTPESPNLIARWVAKARPVINRLPQSIRPAGVGAVTVLLPCGWLYAFAIVAAGSGGVVPAVSVMTAFWVGTLPWLSGLTLAAKPFAVHPNMTRYATAGLLIVAGFYTMTGRATADFQPLIQAARGSSIESLDAVTELPPPCCRNSAAELSREEPLQ